MRKINKEWTILLCLFFFLLTACSQHQQNLSDVDTTNLAQLESVRVQPMSPSTAQTELSGLRSKSLKDTAMSLGAQGGLAWASDQMNTQLNNDRKYLDSVFNFYSMVLSHGVLPPVL